MRSVWRRLRMRWCLATRSMGYGTDAIDILYRIYLNHSKVIHFRRGLPVFSLTTPALFSKPMANFLARTIYRSLQNRNLPNLLSFAVNDACNSACTHCSFFTAVDQPGRPTLSLSEATLVIEQAQELGVSVMNFVGGEPLLRDDLPQIVQSVDKDLSTTLLFTNGWLLEKRIADLKAAGLDSVFVSIDSADAARHDAFRQTHGLFERALVGIRRARKLGLSTGFSVSVTPESWRDGELQRIIELARSVGVHEVLVFETFPTGRYQQRDDMVDNTEWVDAMIRETKPYNRDARYPGVTLFSYVASHRSVGCSCGATYFYVSPYGDVMSCDFNHARFGNVLDEPLWRIWERLSTRPEFRQAKWGGCKIKDSEFRALDSVCAGHDTLEHAWSDAGVERLSDPSGSARPR